MNTRRDFVKKSLLLSAAAGLSSVIPPSIQRAMAINPADGSTYLDAEHVVILMQENRAFDHCFGTMKGVRGFNDPRAVNLPDGNPVWLQTNALGDTYAPFRLDIKDSKITWMGSLPHSRASQVDAFNNGNFDKWLEAKKSPNVKYAEMPLTLGYFTREDLPFNYALADAFTVCDQNFCSAMTSTTPNRSYFWTGKTTEDIDGTPKAHLKNDDFAFGTMKWSTFPELLHENNVPWGFYQNEISCGGGFKEEERAWLSNFGCNLLEFFAAYNVKFSPRYVQELQNRIDTLPGEINELLERSPSTEEAAAKIQKSVKAKQAVLENARAEIKQRNIASFEQLSLREKNLYKSAFIVNSGDPGYRKVANFKYEDAGVNRELTLPEGDILHQFRADVNGGKLPAVSWLAGPRNLSDHPAAPWYGAWYVSEILDILTKNPEVWKKTIFILTYDENDGYFDHVPPFSVPDPKRPETGKASAGINTEVEYVRAENELKLGLPPKLVKEAPIGLGFRVPMIIASPWSRGGKVCSEVFDHTSTLQFLEEFVNKKYNKNIKLDNITAWRRTICGDLTSAFSPFNEKSAQLPFLKKEAHAENIFNAQFKPEPAGFKKLAKSDIETAKKDPSAAFMPRQEKGIKAACALPYQLYADGNFNRSSKAFEIKFGAGNDIFGKRAAGAPFTVYAAGAENRFYAVSPGDSLTDAWSAEHYALRVYGPNGFFREYKGDAAESHLEVRCGYQKGANDKGLTGNISLTLINHDGQDCEIAVTDHGYKQTAIKRTIAKGATEKLVIDLSSSHGWYDFSVHTKGSFEKRYAGRVETGKLSYTDPVMGS